MIGALTRGSRVPARSSAEPSPGVRAGRTVSRYLLRLSARPFSATLLIVLPALLLERLLRLFNLMATASVPAASVMQMLLDLVPHYLGLALPAALFVGIYSVVSRLSTDHELDAMQNAGFSLVWISRPFLAMGLVVAVLGFGLYDYLQPFARYAYRVAFAAATDGAWNGVVPEGELVRLSPELEVIADRADRVTGHLKRVLLVQHLPDGTEKVTTARRASLQPTPDNSAIRLVLSQAIQLRTGPDQDPGTLSAPEATTTRSLVVRVPGFRARGSDEREMTAGELWRSRQAATTRSDRRRLDGELHGRVVRSLSLALLPLLAVPFGLAGKRARRQTGIVLGIVILVVYYHALQLAQSFGTTGRMDPRPALWVLFALFTLGCIHSFRRAARRSADSPLDRLLDVVEDAWRAIRSARRARAEPAGPAA